MLVYNEFVEFRRLTAVPATILPHSPGLSAVRLVVLDMEVDLGSMVFGLLPASRTRVCPVVAVQGKSVPCDSVGKSAEDGCWGSAGCWSCSYWVNDRELPF